MIREWRDSLMRFLSEMHDEQPSNSKEAVNSSVYQDLPGKNDKSRKYRQLKAAYEYRMAGDDGKRKAKSAKIIGNSKRSNKRQHR